MDFAASWVRCCLEGRVTLGLAVVAVVAAALAACGGDDIGNDAAGLLVRNETSGSCTAPAPAKTGTVTPDGQELLPGVATLTAQPSPAKSEGSPSAGVRKEVMVAARNFVNCWNARQYDAVIALISTDFMKAFLVLENPADALIVFGGLPDLTYTVRSLGDPRVHSDGRVSVAIEYTAVHQQKVARWYFAKKDGAWRLDEEERLAFDLGFDNAVVDVEIKEFSYTLSTPKVAAKPSITLRVKNSGRLPHEVVLVRVAPGTDPTKLLQPGVKPEGVEFFGQTMRVPGQQEDIVVTGMTPGQYIMVCQLRFPKGATHSSKGMVGLLTVE
jgi:plastocyanin